MSFQDKKFPVLSPTRFTQKQSQDNRYQGLAPQRRRFDWRSGEKKNIHVNPRNNDYKDIKYGPSQSASREECRNNSNNYSDNKKFYNRNPYNIRPSSGFNHNKSRYKKSFNNRESQNGTDLTKKDKKKFEMVTIDHEKECKQFSSFIKTMNNIKNEDMLNYMIGNFGPKNVRVVYEFKTVSINKDDDGHIENATEDKKEKQLQTTSDQKKENMVKKFCRFILYSFTRNLSSANFAFPGSIVRDGKVLSVPLRPPYSQFSFKHLANKFDKCKITPVQDGTTITLYYYDDRWVISTYRGYEVNSFKWASDITYQQVITAIEDDYVLFSLTELDTKKCYTIGFNHRYYHPFSPPNNENRTVSAWFIRSVNMEDFNKGIWTVDTCEDIGLPLQEKLTWDEVKINTKDMSDYIVKLMKTKKGNTAVAKAYALDDKCQNAHDIFVSSGDVCFGYIVYIGGEQYLMESSLLKNIRKIFYTGKFNQILLPREERYDYITTYAFLDSQIHGTFKELFPERLKMFSSLEKITSDAIANVMKVLNNIQKKSKTHCDMPTDAKTNENIDSCTQTNDSQEIAQENNQKEDLSLKGRPLLRLDEFERKIKDTFQRTVSTSDPFKIETFLYSIVYDPYHTEDLYKLYVKKNIRK